MFFLQKNNLRVLFDGDDGVAGGVEEPVVAEEIRLDELDFVEIPTEVSQVIKDAYKTILKKVLNDAIENSPKNVMPAIGSKGYSKLGLELLNQALEGADPKTLNVDAVQAKSEELVQKVLVERTIKEVVLNKVKELDVRKILSEKEINDIVIEVNKIREFNRNINPEILRQAITERLTNEDVEGRLSDEDKKKLADNEIESISDRKMLDFKTIADQVSVDVETLIHKNLYTLEINTALIKRLDELDVTGTWINADKYNKLAVANLAVDQEILSIQELDLAAIKAKRENIKVTVDSLNLHEMLRGQDNFKISAIIHSHVSNYIDKEWEYQKHDPKKDRSEFKQAVAKSIISGIDRVSGKNGLSAYYNSLGDQAIQDYIRDTVSYIGKNEEGVFAGLRHDQITDASTLVGRNVVGVPTIKEGLNQGKLIHFAQPKFRVEVQKILPNVGKYGLSMIDIKFAEIFKDVAIISDDKILNAISEINSAFSKMSYKLITSKESLEFIAKYHNDANFRSTSQEMLKEFDAKNIHNRKNFLSIISKTHDILVEKGLDSTKENISNVNKFMRNHGFITKGFFSRIFGDYVNAYSDGIEKYKDVIELAVKNPVLYEAMLETVKSMDGLKGRKSADQILDVLNKFKSANLDIVNLRVSDKDAALKLVKENYVNIKNNIVEPFYNLLKGESEKIIVMPEALGGADLPPPPAAMPEEVGVVLPPPPVGLGAAVLPPPPVGLGAAVLPPPPASLVGAADLPQPVGFGVADLPPPAPLVAKPFSESMRPFNPLEGQHQADVDLLEGVDAPVGNASVAPPPPPPLPAAKKQTLDLAGALRAAQENLSEAPAVSQRPLASGKPAVEALQNVAAGLKPAGDRELPPPPPNTNLRDNLLGAIQQGITLKPASPRRDVEEAKPEGERTIVAALGAATENFAAKALANRRGAIDVDDDFIDNGWDDDDYQSASTSGQSSPDLKRLNKTLSKGSLPKFDNAAAIPISVDKSSVSGVDPDEVLKEQGKEKGLS